MSADTVAAICNSYPDVERTVAFLRGAEVSLEYLSTIGLASNDSAEVVGFYLSNGKAKAWGDGHPISEGLFSLWPSVGLFVLPGLGPVLSSGPYSDALSDVVEGRLIVGSSSLLGAGLISLGITRPRVLRYESALKAKECMILYHGPREKVATVKGLLLDCPDCVFVD